MRPASAMPLRVRVAPPTEPNISTASTSVARLKSRRCEESSFVGALSGVAVPLPPLILFRYCISVSQRIAAARGAVRSCAERGAT